MTQLFPKIGSPSMVKFNVKNEAEQHRRIYLVAICSIAVVVMFSQLSKIVIKTMKPRNMF